MYRYTCTDVHLCKYIMYVHKYINTYLSMYIHIYVHIHFCMYVKMSVRAHKHMYLHTNISKHIHTNMYVFIKYIQMKVHMNIHGYYIYYTHTHT